MSNLSPAYGARSLIAQYDLAFQISPIFLVGGIVAGSQGQLAPIVQFTGGIPGPEEEPFARYIPQPGSTLISQAIGMYPFANQAVAANATIQEPLTISLAMLAPVNQAGGYTAKLQRFTALQQTLQQHNAAGGMYTVATPAFIFYNVLMTQMTDITAEDEKQQQIHWQIDFIKPILTVQDAVAQQGAFIQRVTNGGQFTSEPTWSGNPSSSAANLPGMTGALGNVEAALATFGGSV